VLRLKVELKAAEVILGEDDGDLSDSFDGVNILIEGDALEGFLLESEMIS